MKINIHAESAEIEIINGTKVHIATFATPNKFNKLERFNIPIDEKILEDILNGSVEFELEQKAKV